MAAAKWVNAEQRAKHTRLSRGAEMARLGITPGDIELSELFAEATANPQGMRKEELFRIFTEGSIEDASAKNKAAAKQFALDNLGPDTRAVKLGNPYKNKGVLATFGNFYPKDTYFRALLSGLGGK